MLQIKISHKNKKKALHKSSTKTYIEKNKKRNGIHISNINNNKKEKYNIE